LKLKIHGAKLASPFDCEVKVKYEEFEQETETEKKTQTPHWDKDMVIQIFDTEYQPVKVKLDGKGAGPLGVLELNVAAIRAAAQQKEQAAAGDAAATLDERSWHAFAAPEKVKEKVKAALYEGDAEAPSLDLTDFFVDNPTALGNEVEHHILTSPGLALDAVTIELMWPRPAPT